MTPGTFLFDDNFQFHAFSYVYLRAHVGFSPFVAWLAIQYPAKPEADHSGVII